MIGDHLVVGVAQSPMTAISVMADHWSGEEKNKNNPFQILGTLLLYSLYSVDAIYGLIFFTIPMSLKGLLGPHTHECLFPHTLATKNKIN